MRIFFTVIGWLVALFVGACLDEWQVWRRNRCMRAAMRRRP